MFMTNYIQKVITEIIILTQQQCGKCNHKPEQIAFYKDNIQKILHKELEELIKEIQKGG